MPNEHLKQPNPGDPTSEITLSEIHSDIEAIEKNLALYEEKNFTGRVEAIDFIEFHLVDRINGLLQSVGRSEDLEHMKKHTEELKEQLEKIDGKLFQRLRADIRLGKCRGEAFRDMIEKYMGDSLKVRWEQTTIGYDNLDIFLDGLFRMEIIPVETKEREPEMVFYQKTPASIIFELLDKAHFNQEDVFYDLGSGLGHVALLVNLVSGVRTKGIEFEPAYCNYARACADQLNLPDVQFINADAREADYSDGTVFFMYTPFEGRMLGEVLEKVRLESRNRQIKLFTYGPCTLRVTREGWLTSENSEQQDVYKLGMFRSLET